MVKFVSAYSAYYTTSSERLLGPHYMQASFRCSGGFPIELSPVGPVREVARVSGVDIIERPGVRTQVHVS